MLTAQLQSNTALTFPAKPIVSQSDRTLPSIAQLLTIEQLPTIAIRLMCASHIAIAIV